jgi:MoaA/NifB/PqqE/SkfB family radical SAM enzyme
VNPVIGQIPYRIFRAWGRPRILPLNYTISVTSRCNYRCATCRVFRQDRREMTVEDYRKVFRSLGRSPYWATFSGGEPFLREDLREIIGWFCRLCRPRLVNLPTNGSLPQRVAETAGWLSREHPGTDFMVNVSIDGVGQEQDRIRGNPRAWDNAVATLELLKRDRPKNLLVGIGTVISKENLGRFAGIRARLSGLGADSMVAEVAENRKELDNSSLEITPAPEEYAAIADLLTAEIDADRKSGWAGLAQSFRRRYYRQVGRALRGEPSWPCYAGFASVQIMPDGEVWACCMEGDLMGRLRDFDWDLAKLWRSPQADRVRRSIKSRRCGCPLANAAYTNMTFSLSEGLRVLADHWRPGRRW